VDTLWKLFKWGEHIHFAAYLAGLLGSALTFVWAAWDGRSALNVWVLAIVVFAALLITVNLLTKARDGSEALAVWPDNNANNRIPCTEFLKTATAAGWDFDSTSSLHLIDLQDAMRQGGLDGTLAIWGRKNKWRSDDLMRKEVLEQIPQDHWREYFVHLHAAKDDDNFRTYNWIPAPGERFGERGYIDLHVDRGQARRWLQGDALSFKGKTKF
jgi:hypothetical protein